MSDEAAASTSEVTAAQHVARIVDAGFGTRNYTHGAVMQRPRKIPIRLEPKTYFANERTFLSWSSMAVAFGATSSALTSLIMNKGDVEQAGPISPQTVALMSMALSPVAVGILWYALLTYWYRVEYMKKKEVGFYDDRVGAVVITSLIAIVLLSITVAAYYSFFTR